MPKELAVNSVHCLRWHRVLTTNATDTSFAANIPTFTDPGPTDLATGVMNWSNDGVTALESVFFQFFGAGADDTTFDAKVIGWRRAGDNDLTAIWTTVHIADVSVILSTLVGIAGKYVIETDRFADTVTLNDGVGIVYQSADANSIVSTLEVDTLGCQKGRVIYDLTGATANARAADDAARRSTATAGSATTPTCARRASVLRR